MFTGRRRRPSSSPSSGGGTRAVQGRARAGARRNFGTLDLILAWDRARGGELGEFRQCVLCTPVS